MKPHIERSPTPPAVATWTIGKGYAVVKHDGDEFVRLRIVGHETRIPVEVINRLVASLRAAKDWPS